MSSFLRRPTSVSAVAVCAALVLAATAAGQNPPTSTAANPPPAQASVPPLHLTDAQREQVRAALRDRHTSVSFNLKSAKSAESFEPAVGAKLPKGITAHALPPPVIYDLPVLKQYKYVKFKDQVLIVNPMTKQIVDLFAQG